MLVLQIMVPSGLLQISHKLEKLWRHNFLTWRYRHFFFFFFWGCLISLVNFSYWSKFHVNIISFSGVMTILFYTGLTRNLEIGNIPVWVFPWRLGQFRDTKFRQDASNKMLLNAAKCKAYSFYSFWVTKRKPKGGWRGEVELFPTQVRVKLL